MSCRVEWECIWSRSSRWLFWFFLPPSFSYFHFTQESREKVKANSLISLSYIFKSQFLRNIISPSTALKHVPHQSIRFMRFLFLSQIFFLPWSSYRKILFLIRMRIFTFRFFSQSFITEYISYFLEPSVSVFRWA